MIDRRSTLVTLAALAAALPVALPAGAQARPIDQPVQTSSLAGTTSAMRLGTAPSDLRSPDAVDAAAGPVVDLRSPDVRDAAQRRTAVVTPRGVSAPLRATIKTTNSDELGWGDAAIIGGATAAAAALAGGVLLAGQRRRHHPTTASR